MLCREVEMMKRLCTWLIKAADPANLRATGSAWQPFSTPSQRLPFIPVSDLYYQPSRLTFIRIPLWFPIIGHYTDARLCQRERSHAKVRDVLTWLAPGLAPLDKDGCTSWSLGEEKVLLSEGIWLSGAPASIWIIYNALFLTGWAEELYFKDSHLKENSPPTCPLIPPSSCEYRYSLNKKRNPATWAWNLLERDKNIHFLYSTCHTREYIRMIASYVLLSGHAYLYVSCPAAIEHI